MAGGQERVLRRRIKSVQSTKKITRAMELIAATRVAKAQQRANEERAIQEMEDIVAEHLETLDHLPPQDVGETIRRLVPYDFIDRQANADFDALVQSLQQQAMQSLFQIHPINLSVAVWVGFLALFGIASDDGVVITTYLDQSFFRRNITSSAEAREATLAAGLRRVRPCLMTTATTILALIPVLTSTGRGSDIMVPMAIPSFGGMMIEIMTMLVVPVLYCSVMEWKLRLGIEDPRFAENARP